MDIYADLQALFSSPEIYYPVLVFLLFVFPRFLSRFGIPTAIVAFVFGAIASIGFSSVGEDQVVGVLATFGIVSLFLLAGLELEYEELKTSAKPTLGYIAFCVAILAGTSFAVSSIFDLGFRTACLFALALITPSVGFILDALEGKPVEDLAKHWIKTKAVAWEIVAIGALFTVNQSDDLIRFSVSIVIIFAMIFLLPLVFRIFAKRIAPYAPRSEFGFLLLLAIVCALVTKALGAYYLIGAFIVGIFAKRSEELMPDMTSEEMIHSIKVFSSFFIPFYFFHAGQGLTLANFTWHSSLLALLFLLVLVPARLLLVVIHRKLFFKETMQDTLLIAVRLLPTLVFGLVLANILRDKHQMNETFYGALILYTLVVTIMPSIIRGLTRKSKLPKYEPIPVK